jgi:phosphate transport system permease protein
MTVVDAGGVQQLPHMTHPLLSPNKGSRSRKVRNSIWTALIMLSFVVALIPLVAVVLYVFQRGADQLNWAFLTDPIPISDREIGPGMGPAVAGTLLITGAAALMAIPLGVLGGIYLNEYGGTGFLARIVRFLSDVMTGVPSVVMGLFIYTFVVLETKEFNAFAGALALACLMLPIVIRTTDEMLKLVPRELREGSYALGSRKSRTIRTVVLPNAAPGIISGALLAVARAAGETAPLIFTVGIVSESNWSLFNGPNTALSQQIYRNASSPFPGAQDRAWGAALTLIAIVFIFTALARLVTAFFQRRQSA